MAAIFEFEAVDPLELALFGEPRNLETFPRRGPFRPPDGRTGV